MKTRILPLQFANDSLITKDLSLLKTIWEQVTFRINSYERVMRSTSPNANANDNTEFFKIICVFIEEDDSKGLIRELTNLYSELSLIPTRIMISVLKQGSTV
ncbi:CRB_1a_G0055030.mRNA.1.CDS.1 [Saccharomyces cerevisiae]|nr:CRB_1a_G0055030.mRNA.1.CDS.1 [Saccharomyces cerevisiae]CAI7481010.1 CRB_1a_G0055030.mRNA.1.CDS.1 [Saccharomyces cerevisiae]